MKIDPITIAENKVKLNDALKKAETLQTQLQISGKGLNPEAVRNSAAITSITKQLTDLQNPQNLLSEAESVLKDKLPIKELPIKPEFNRTKEVPITITDILDQASYIGCYIGGHPLHMTNIDREDLDTLEEGFRYRVAGVVISNRIITTKKGKKMAVLEIDDSTKAAEIVIFPQVYETFASLNINEGDIIIADVKCEEVEPDLKLIGNKFLKHVWDIKDDDKQKELLLDFPGGTNPF